jgi:hypothetical protein
MALHASRDWTRRLVVFACWPVAALMAGSAIAADPHPIIYADVRITFAGQTFESAGIQRSFDQTQDGGRIVFDIRTLGAPGYAPVPAIDASNLQPMGNRWEVSTKLHNHDDAFIGTCASQTFTEVDASGTVIRNLFLNCSELEFQ